MPIIRNLVFKTAFVINLLWTGVFATRLLTVPLDCELTFFTSCLKGRISFCWPAHISKGRKSTTLTTLTYGLTHISCLSLRGIAYTSSLTIYNGLWRKGSIDFYITHWYIVKRNCIEIQIETPATSTHPKEAYKLKKKV